MINDLRPEYKLGSSDIKHVELQSETQGNLYDFAQTSGPREGDKSKIPSDVSRGLALSRLPLAVPKPPPPKHIRKGTNVSKSLNDDVESSIMRIAFPKRGDG